MLGTITYQDHCICDLLAQNGIPLNARVTFELILAKFGSQLLDLSWAQALLEIESTQMGSQLLNGQLIRVLLILLEVAELLAGTHDTATTVEKTAIGSSDRYGGRYGSIDERE